MSIKIGIPRALLYYEFYPLWITFFELLGAEVVISSRTNKQIVESGVQHTVDEACIPVKLFHGHVVDLRDKVDYIFVPRLRSICKGEYICPKFCGLPEMVRHSIKDLPTLIDITIDCIKSNRDLKNAVFAAGNFLTEDRDLITTAFQTAYIAYKEHKMILKKQLFPPFKRKKIMVLGHPYTLYDSYLNMDLLQKLEACDTSILTPEMLPKPVISHYAQNFDGQLYWSFAKKLIGTVLYLKDTKSVDGVIYISTFGCGVDSVVAHLVEKIIRRDTTLPFMLITLDEHTGEAGINTRIEAFIDMLKWRDSDENHISSHG